MLYCCLLNVLAESGFHFFESLVADNVLDTAGIGICGGFGNADRDEIAHEYAVTFVYLACAGFTRSGQCDETVIVDDDHVFASELAQGAADARLGVTGLINYIDGAYMCLLLAKSEYIFEIHLA